MHRFPMPSARPAPSRRALLAWGIVTLAVLPASAQAQVPYTCRDGARFTVAFRGAGGGLGSAILTMLPTGRRVHVRQALSADGGRYVGPGLEFWIKGETATLDRKGVTVSCRTDR